MIDGSGTQALVGRPVPARGDDLLVEGRAEYIDDMRFEDALHVRFVRSFVAHAQLLRVEVPSPTRSGTVVTAADLGSPPPLLSSPYRPAGKQMPGWPLLAHDRIRFAGEPIAAAIAPDPYQAEDLAELVSMEFEELPIVVNTAKATRGVTLHDEWPDNVVFERTLSVGDVKAVRRSSDVTVRRTFRTSRHTGVPIETRGCVARVRSGRLRLWSSTQVPHLVRSAVASVLGWTADKVEVVSPAVGGGFGIKGHVYPEEVLISLLAVQLGGTIKWIEDRAEHMVASVHAQDHLFDLELQLRSDGTILGLSADLTVDAGAYAAWPQTPALDVQMSAAILPGPYVIPNYHFTGRAVLTNKTPSGTYRGVARPSCAFALERLIDEAALELSIDPIEMRLKNVVRDFPHATGTGLVYDSGSIAASLERVREIVDQTRSRDDEHGNPGELHGVGVACFVEQTGHVAPWARAGAGVVHDQDRAVVTANEDGRIRVFVGSASTGQSHDTMLAQIVAERLDVPLEQVEVSTGDTARTPFSMGTLASRAAVVGGGTALAATERLRSTLLDLASRALSVPAEGLRLCASEVRETGSSARTISIEELARRFGRTLDERNRRVISATARYDGPDGGTFSNACHAAVVAIDPETGQIAVTRYVVIEDCGTMINPLVVDGQVYGGVAQGLGAALFERLVYDEQGQILTGTLMDYPLPSTLEVPDIEVHHLSTPGVAPTGIKGVGESGAIGPMAAVANAVADALGPARAHLVREVPLVPARIWAILHQGGSDDPGWDNPGRGDSDGSGDDPDGDRQ